MEERAVWLRGFRAVRSETSYGATKLRFQAHDHFWIDKLSALDATTPFSWVRLTLKHL